MYDVILTTKEGTIHETINDITELGEVLLKYPDYVSVNVKKKVKTKVRRK